MADPLQQLVDELKEIKSRLHKLEVARRAPYTAVRGGNFWFLEPDAAENEWQPSVVIGAGVSGDPAIWIMDESLNGAYFGHSASGGGVHLTASGPDGDGIGRALDIYQGKMYVPRLATTWQMGTNLNVDAQGRPTHNTATYTIMWRAWLAITMGRIYTIIHAYPGAGNTMDVRVMAEFLTGVGSGTGPQLVVQDTGITTTSTLAGPWTIPDSVKDPAGSPVGTIVELTIEIRRTAGAGAVAVAPFPVTNWL